MGLFSSIMKPINKGMSSIFGDELGQALTTAAIAALAVYSGGAIAGALGGGATGTGVGVGGIGGTTGLAEGGAEIAAQTAPQLVQGGTEVVAQGGTQAAAKMTAHEVGVAALKSGAGATAVGMGGVSGYQAGMQQKAQEKAEAEAARALREQEITRKKALLAEQTSVSKRMNQAQNVRNNLQGLSSGMLGGSKQLLGG